VDSTLTMLAALSMELEPALSEWADKALPGILAGLKPRFHRW